MPDQLTGFDNSVYFTDTGTDEVGVLTPMAGSTAESPLPSNTTLGGGIVWAPDGNLYFAAIGSGNLGEIDEAPPALGPITVFDVAPITDPVGITSISSTSGTSVYFTEPSADAIGELSVPSGPSISPTESTFASFGIPTANSEPEGIAVGPGNNIYFTESATGKIGELNTTTHEVTEFIIPTTGGISPGSISALTIVDGPPSTSSLYFTEPGIGEIGELNTASEVAPTPVPANETITTPDGSSYTSTLPIPAGMLLPPGTITEVMIPTPNSEPVGIAVGAKNNIYFTEGAGDKIGELSTQTEMAPGYVPAGETITTPDGMTYVSGSAVPGPNLPAGTITEFTVPSGNGPGSIVQGPGGNIWFTLDDGGVLAYLNPVTGTITDPAYPQQSFVVAELASGVGPNYDLYLTDDVHNQIGEVSSIGQPIITLGPPPAHPTDLWTNLSVLPRAPEAPFGSRNTPVMKSARHRPTAPCKPRPRCICCRRSAQLVRASRSRSQQWSSRRLGAALQPVTSHSLSTASNSRPWRSPRSKAHKKARRRSPSSW